MAGSALPPPEVFARNLPGGILRSNGHVEFQDPFDPKPGKRPCAVWFGEHLPGGWTVGDARPDGKQRDPIVLRDKVRDLVVGLEPFQPRSKSNSRNGSNGHRPAGGSIVREPSHSGVRVGEDRAARRLYLLPFDEIKLVTRRRDLVRGLVPRVGLTAIWGPPKIFKSFFTLDLFMHVALGWDYRGRRVHQGPVVYCYFEGQAAASQRIEAFRQERLAEAGGEHVPFYLMPVTMNLVAEFQALIETIKDTLGATAPVAVVLDTLNRSFAGSESSDVDMSNYVKACDALRETFECAVVIVHHCGHEGTRLRGHSSLLGAADATIAVKQVSDDGLFVAKLEHMKDGPSGEEIVGRARVVTVGVNEDGDEITSCVIDPVDPTSASTKEQQPAAKLSSDARIALKALKKAIAEAGAVPPACNHIPPDTPTVSLGVWRRHAYQMNPTDSEKPDTRKKAFQRHRTTLQVHGLVGIWGTENGSEGEAQCWPIT